MMKASIECGGIMEKREKGMILSIALAMIAVMLGPVSPLYAQPSVDYSIDGANIDGENPVTLSMVTATELTFELDLESVLAPGVLGLPGETVEWVANVENTGSAAGHDVMITTTLHESLRIDAVNVVRGDVTVEDNVVSIAVGELAAGDMVAFSIQTTVVRSPANGKLFSQTVVSANGPVGAMTHSVSSEMYVPTGLPATGYAVDEELPGDGEPSVVAVGLMAFSTVMAAALFVWYRGRRYSF